MAQTVTLYGDSRSGNCDKVRFTLDHLGQTIETRDEVCVRRGERALGIMEDWLGKRDWFVGEALTLADIALIAYTRNAERGGFDLQHRPSLRAWIARTQQALGVES